jgi:hypothetical protein
MIDVYVEAFNAELLEIFADLEAAARLASRCPWVVRA